VNNVGEVDSAQVVQMYASLDASFAANPATVSRHVPIRQLVDFDKVFVRAGSSVDVVLTMVPSSLAGWELWHAPTAVVHLAVGGVSPTTKTLSLGELVLTSITVTRD
jgi:hypothetical protein